MSEGWVQETVQGNSFWYYYDSNGDRVTDWIKWEGDWYYCYSDGTMAKNTMVHGYYVNADGKWTKEEISREIVDGNKNHFWYYIGPSGKAVTGWNKIGENFHYYNSPDGSMTRNNTIDGFDIDDYGNIDGGTGWLRDEYSGKWYYYSNGSMQTGWIRYGNKWYYNKADGSMATGWIKDDNDKFYYLDSDGQMLTGWVNDGNGWYYLYDSGAMTYENTVGGYHLDKTGIMVTGTGWKPVDGLWYYLDHDKVVTGWIQDKGNWYYLYPKSDDKTHIEGSMAENTIINGWKVDSSGKWIKGEDDSNSEGMSDADYDNLYVNGKYDRDSAVAYATNPEYTSPDKNDESTFDWKKHTRNYNREYERYDSYDYYAKGHLSGSDCANFVSQAIYLGGIKQTEKWYFKWNIKVNSYGIITKEANAAVSWIRPKEQLDYLRNNGYINGEPIEVNSPEEANNDITKYGIQKGDLVYLKNSSEGLHHAMIITEVKDGKIYISAHSNDHINAEYDNNYFQDGNSGLIVRMK